MNIWLLIFLGLVLIITMCLIKTLRTMNQKLLDTEFKLIDFQMQETALKEALKNNAKKANALALNNIMLYAQHKRSRDIPNYLLRTYLETWFVANDVTTRNNEKLILVVLNQHSNTTKRLMQSLLDRHHASLNAHDLNLTDMQELERAYRELFIKLNDRWNNRQWVLFTTSSGAK